MKSFAPFRPRFTTRLHLGNLYNDLDISYSPKDQTLCASIMCDDGSLKYEYYEYAVACLFQKLRLMDIGLL